MPKTEKVLVWTSVPVPLVVVEDVGLLEGAHIGPYSGASRLPPFRLPWADLWLALRDEMQERPPDCAYFVSKR